MSIRVDDLVTYSVVTCDDETSVSAYERVIYIKGLQATIAYYVKVRWVNVITCTYYLQNSVTAIHVLVIVVLYTLI